MIKLIFCTNINHNKGVHVLPHSHECNELIFYGKTARGETEIGGKTYLFAPASVALIHLGTMHSEKHLEDTDLIYFGFESSVSLQDGVWYDMQEVETLFCDIMEEIKNQQWGYENIISLKIQEILAYMERRLRGESISIKNLAYCKKYIEENYMQDISVNKLAKMTCYSIDRFRHLFAEEFGVYPKNYLSSVRLKNAERLLRTTNLSCTEISVMCGFSDGGQMTKMFKKNYNITPKEIRNTCAKG